MSVMSKRLSKRRIIVLIFLAIIIIVVLVVAFIIVPGLNKPVTGTIITTNVKSDIVSIKLTPKPQAGKYVSFNYPAGMTPRPAGPITPPNLENYVYHAADTQSWLLAVNVSVPAGGLSGDSGYAFRKNNPTTYQATTITVKGQPVIVMSDQTANFAKVAYVMQGPELTTVALSGYDNAGTVPLQAAFMLVLNSLHWQ